MTLFPLCVDNMSLNISAPRIHLNGLESDLHKLYEGVLISP